MIGPHDGLATFAMTAGLALALSLVLTPLTRRLAWRRGLVAQPAVDRWHRRRVAMLGGVPVWLATLTAVLFMGGLSAETTMVALGSSALFVLGLVDDFLPLKPTTKLSAEIVIACVVIAFGYQLHWTGSPLIDALVTIVWIAGITNAFNLLDNMDGLCAGVAAIAAVAFCGSIGTAERAPSRLLGRARRRHARVPALQLQSGVGIPRRLRAACCWVRRSPCWHFRRRHPDRPS